MWFSGQCLLSRLEARWLWVGALRKGGREKGVSKEAGEELLSYFTYSQTHNLV